MYLYSLWFTDQYTLGNINQNEVHLISLHLCHNINFDSEIKSPIKYKTQNIKNLQAKDNRKQFILITKYCTKCSLSYSVLTQQINVWLDLIISLLSDVNIVGLMAV